VSSAALRASRPPEADGVVAQLAAPGSGQQHAAVPAQQAQVHRGLAQLEHGQGLHLAVVLAIPLAGQAAGDDPLEYVARMLWEAGWQASDGTPLTKWDARNAAEDTHTVLIRLGALARARRVLDPEQPTRDGAVFARAALRTWSE